MKFISLLTLLLFGINSYSAEKFNCPTKDIVAAFDDRGYNYFKGVGIDADLLTAIEKETNCKIKRVEMPRARIFELLKTGEVGMAFFVIKTEDREKYSYFIPYLLQGNILITKKGFSRKIKTLDAFEKDKALLFSKINGFKHEENYDDFLDRLEKSNRLFKVNGTDSLLKMVIEDRAQGIFSLPIVYSMYLDKDFSKYKNELEFIDWQKSMSPRVGPKPHEIALSRNTFSERQFDDMKKIISKLHQNKTILNIMKKYLKNENLGQSILKN